MECRRGIMREVESWGRGIHELGVRPSKGRSGWVEFLHD